MRILVLIAGKRVNPARSGSKGRPCSRCGLVDPPLLPLQAGLKFFRAGVRALRFGSVNVAILR